MQPWLIFSLTASLGAMGELAGHERRGSLIWPGRSAIIGLLGAAMGIRREGDFSALDALQICVAVFDSGQALRDFHTVQTVPSAAVKAPNSRPEALAAVGTRVNTTITLRDYRAGALYGIAVTGAEDTLAALAAALQHPRFQLFLGRKSCPLAAPPGPAIVHSDGPEVALQSLTLPPWRKGARADLLVADAGPDDGHREIRHDQPLSRELWHFGPREVAYRTVRIAPGSAPADNAVGEIN